MILVADKNKSVFWFFASLFIFFLSVTIFTDEYYWTLIPFGIIISYCGWQNSNIVFFLLLITLPFSAEYHFNSELGTDIPDEFLMLITAGLFLLYFIYRPETIPKNYLRHPLIIFLLFSMIWILVAAFFSTNPFISFKFFLAKCWYLGAFVLAPLIIFRNKKTITKAAVVIAASMFVVASVILIRHAGYNFRFADINDAATPFFRNHVNYSAMLVCAIPLFFAFYSHATTKKMKWLIVGAILILLTALFFSYSRGAWLALLVGLISYWGIKKRLLFQSFVAAIIFFVGFLFWAKTNDRYLQYAPDFKTTIFHKDFREHLIATYKLKDVSTEERFYRWIAGLRMIKDNELTGFGPNTFYYNYKPYTIPAFKTWVSDNSEHSTVHNYFLLVAIEQGIPGLIFFLILIGGMLCYAQRIYHRATDLFHKSVAATTGAVISMVIVVNFLSDLIETDKIGSIFFLCLSVLVVADTHISFKGTNEINSNNQPTG
ncbi:MAG: O-antigen ligase family protein [Bacteroidetes bacterium]|nr:O-antigen ligase family protein [Bacteroidota bacterium]